MTTPTEALKLARNALDAYLAAFDGHLVTNTNGARDFDFTGTIAESAKLSIAAIDALAQPQPSAPSVEPAADLREKLIAAIAAGLVSTYHCNRVWSAWHVGTMSEDDFSPVDESDTPAEIADVVLSIIGAAPLMANGLTEAETAATASVAGLAGATKHTEAVDHAHELLRRLGYHRDGDHFINVNRAGAEAMHVSTIATIVHAALIVASATPPAAPAPAVQPLPARLVRFTLRDLKAERKRLDGFISLGNEIERAAEYDEWIAALEAYCTAHGITAAPTKE